MENSDLNKKGNIDDTKVIYNETILLHLSF